MIIKMRPYSGAATAVFQPKIVVLHGRQNAKENKDAGRCSQLYASKSSKCTVMSTKLWVIYKNYN